MENNTQPTAPIPSGKMHRLVMKWEKANPDKILATRLNLASRKNPQISESHKARLRRLSESARSLLKIFNDFQGKDRADLGVWHSLKQLGDFIDKQPSTVSEALRELSELGLIRLAQDETRLDDMRKERGLPPRGDNRIKTYFITCRAELLEQGNTAPPKSSERLQRNTDKKTNHRNTKDLSLESICQDTNWANIQDAPKKPKVINE